MACNGRWRLHLMGSCVTWSTPGRNVNLCPFLSRQMLTKTYLWSVTRLKNFGSSLARSSAGDWRWTVTISLAWRNTLPHITLQPVHWLHSDQPQSTLTYKDESQNLKLRGQEKKNLTRLCSLTNKHWWCRSTIAGGSLFTTGPRKQFINKTFPKAYQKRGYL